MIATDLEVYQAEGNPEEWVVGSVAHPPVGDGEMYMAYFEGPRAEERAREYAAWKAPELNTEDTECS